MFINRSDYGVETLDLEKMFKERGVGQDIKPNWEFEIAVWHAKYFYRDLSCHVDNFLPLEDIEDSNIIGAVDSCIKLHIKPNMEEVLQMKSIPHEWLDEISTLNDLYKSFRIPEDIGIEEVIQGLDDKLTPTNKPIVINISTQQDTLINSRLYNSIKEKIDLKELKNFHISKGLFLSEVDSKDANEIVKIAKKGGYDSIIAKGRTLTKSEDEDLNVEQYAELIRVASRHGIIVDMYRCNVNTTEQVYKTLYKQMYREDTVEDTVNRLKEEIEKYGNKFFLTLNFSGFYPVEFVEQREEGLVFKLRECNVEGIKTDIVGRKFTLYERINEDTFLFLSKGIEYQVNCIVNEVYVSSQDDYTSEIVPI